MNPFDPINTPRRHPDTQANVPTTAARRPAPDALDEGALRCAARQRLSSLQPAPPPPATHHAFLRYGFDPFMSAPVHLDPLEAAAVIGMNGTQYDEVAALLDMLGIVAPQDREEVALTLRMLRQLRAPINGLGAFLTLRQNDETHWPWKQLAAELSLSPLLGEHLFLTRVVDLLRGMAASEWPTTLKRIQQYCRHSRNHSSALLDALTRVPLPERSLFMLQCEVLYLDLPRTPNLARLIGAFAGLQTKQREDILDALEKVRGMKLSPSQYEELVATLIRYPNPQAPQLLEMLRPAANASQSPAQFGGLYGSCGVDWVDLPKTFITMSPQIWPHAISLLQLASARNEDFSGPLFFITLKSQPLEHRETLLSQTIRLMQGRRTKVDPYGVANRLAKVPFALREAYIGALERLGVYELSSHSRVEVFDQLFIVGPLHWDSFAAQVRCATQKQTCKGQDFARMAKELAHVSHDEREQLAQLVHDTCGTWVRGAPRYMVARFYARLPRESRALFAQEALRYVHASTGASPIHFRRVIESLACSPDTDPVQTVRQALRLRRVTTQLADNETIISLMAILPGAHQEEFVDRMLGLNFTEGYAASAARVLFNHFRRGDMLMFLRECEPLAAQVADDDTRLDLFRAIAATAPDTRAQHMQTLLAMGHAPEDDENVMRTSAINATHDAIRAFLPIAPTPPDVQETLTEMVRFFEAYFATRMPESVEEILDPFWGLATDAERRFAERVRTSDGATELQNAIRVIEGDPDPRTGQRGLTRPGDYSNPLRRSDRYTYGSSASEKIRVGTLLARLWEFVKVYPGFNGNTESIAQAQANMRYGVFTALCFCVERDAHIVCGVGFVRRIMSILQGRIAGAAIDSRPPVAQAFNDTCQRYFMQPIVGDDGEVALDEDGLVQFEQRDIFKTRAPLSAELRTFYNGALGSAAAIYDQPANPEDGEHLYNQFKKQALEFLEVTYVWNPDVDDAKYDAE